MMYCWRLARYCSHTSLTLSTSEVIVALILKKKKRIYACIAQDYLSEDMHYWRLGNNTFSASVPFQQIDFLTASLPPKNTPFLDAQNNLDKYPYSYVTPIEDAIAGESVDPFIFVNGG